MIQSRRATSSSGFLYLWVTLALGLTAPAHAVSVGGSVAVTSDYIYRGYSETNNEAAAQLDLHLTTLTGTFVGVFASSLNHHYRPWADVDLEEYIGQRFLLSSAWSTSISATNYSYVGGHQSYSSDYQQLSAEVSYLDRWTFSFSAMPNMLRYWRTNTGQTYEYRRTGRYPAYDVETSGQWLLGKGFFITGGVGYYLFTGTDSTPFPQPTRGYAYGNVGLAYEWHSWRVDVGYFITENVATQRLFPYPSARDRFAGTVSWRF